MGIIYLVSVLILIMAFALVKKTEKVLDILSFIGIAIVVFLCYNAFICYVLTFFKIPITLSILTIINILLSIPMYLIIYKRKEIQKYKFEKLNAICIVIILILVLIVSYLNFGFPLNIKYESGDPSVHYLTSKLFAEQDSLLNLYEDEMHGGLAGRKIGSYVNSGIIMKCFSNVINEVDNYKIFIVFGIFTLFMTGSMMYSTLEKYTKSKEGRLIALLASVIYVLAYPLNSLLFGFEYLSLGILVVRNNSAHDILF